MASQAPRRLTVMQQEASGPFKKPGWVWPRLPPWRAGLRLAQPVSGGDAGQWQRARAGPGAAAGTGC